MKMNKPQRYLIVIFLFTLIFCVLFINFKVFQSYKFQKTLILDWNNAQLTIEKEKILKFDPRIPNISYAGMPLGFMKARYIINDSVFSKEALDMFYNAENSNKYLGIHNNELASYYLGKKNVDSAYANSKKAFHRLPNNVHVNNFFNILSNLKKEKELDSAFNVIKENKREFQWRDYLFKKMEKFNNAKNDTLHNLINEAESFFVDQNSITILRELNQKGTKGFDDYFNILESAEFYFNQNDFEKAIIEYTKANLIDPNEPTNLSNLAICFFKLGRFNQAIITFKRYIKEFDSTGLEEIYIAACYFEIGETSKGCEYAFKAQKKGYSGANELLELFCR